MRDLVNIGADAFENIRGAVDHRIEDVHHYGLAVRTFGGHVARQPVGNDREGLRLVVAHRDQPVTRQNERNRGGFRALGIRLAHQRRGHVARAVFDVEPAGDLDLQHLFTGRNRDAECALDQLVFRERRGDEINPDRAFGKFGAVIDRHLLKRCPARNVD